MYSELTTERCLFFIEQQDIEKYLSLSERMKEYSYIIDDEKLNRDNSLIIAFNFWLLLQPSGENHIIQSVEKMLYYSSDYLIYDTLKKDDYFKSFKQRYGHHPELAYLASLCFATYINNWCYHILEKNDIVYLRDKYTTLDYLDAIKGSKKVVQELLHDQASFIKAMAKELKTDSFNKMIRKTCDEALQIYKQHEKESSLK